MSLWAVGGFKGGLQDRKKYLVEMPMRLWGGSFYLQTISVIRCDQELRMPSEGKDKRAKQDGEIWQSILEESKITGKFES